MSDISSSDVGLEFKRPQVVPNPLINTGSANAGCSNEGDHEKRMYWSKKVPYNPPQWSRIPPEGTNYALEIMKSGVIIKKIKLIGQSYFVFGRFSTCEVYMAHPTLSRYHAVLQYKGTDDVEQPPGWYIYDLGSSHGSYVNKKQIGPKKYVRMRVGDQVVFGASSRNYILVGPEFDLQGEPNLTVAEIKIKAEELKLKRERKLELRAERLNNGLQEQSLDEQDTQTEELLRINKEKKEEILQKEKEKEGEMLRKQKEKDEEMLRKQKEKEEDGIDWGMGDDLEEPEPDLADNPYASTSNEDLYLQDPKKTLRGFFSREGVDLNYDCEEKGPGQFSCRVQLPVDDAQGRPVIAEAIHRGKKKDAVVACALEACRILDRMGVLRQAKHESRRRKERDWGADDYYDSEDDTFFDRTGNVEKKRQARMEKLGVVTSQSQSYDDLTKKIKELQADIIKHTEAIKQVREEMVQNTKYTESADDLMKSSEPIPNNCQSNEHKEKISKCKLKIKELQAELTETRRLAQIARPTNLPQLAKNKTSIPIKKTNSVIYGKRMRLKEDSNKKTPNFKVIQEKSKESEVFVIEVDSDEEETAPSTSTAVLKENQTSESTKTSNTDISTKNCNQKTDTSPEKQTDENRITNRQPAKKKEIKGKKMYGPTRPPENYVIPDSYYDQVNDRDLPEITEKSDT